MLTGVAFGLLPAVRATQVDLAGAMKQSGRSVTGARTVIGKGLVVVQIAMSLVLVVGAGLFLRTLANLKSVDVGFDSRNLLVFNVNPRINGYDVERSSRVFHQMLERMAAMPGVTSAALTRAPLLSSTTFMDPTWKQGQASQAPAVGTMYKMDVSPAFFATMGIPSLRGRNFSDRDGASGPKVAILNETAARQLFPDGDVLGRRIGESFEKSGEFEVVGVVRDTKYASVRDPGPPTMYRCVWQTTSRNLYVVLRTTGEPLAMSDTVRAAMREIDPTLPIQEFTSQSDQISQRLAQERLFARAYAAFGGLAVLLACIGLFGLMSYNVARRTGEIGVRLALGAQRKGRDRHGDERVHLARRHRRRAGSSRRPVGRSICTDGGVRLVTERSLDDRRRGGARRRCHGPRRRRASAARLERESDRGFAAAVGVVRTQTSS